MLEVLIGVAAGAGLVLVARRGRRWGHHRHGRGFRFARDLGLTPEQEREVARASSVLRDAGWDLFGSARELRKGLAAAVDSEACDEKELDEQLERMGANLTELRVKVLEEVRSLHASLDPSQRQKVATWLLAPRGFGFRHCRHGVHA